MSCRILQNGQLRCSYKRVPGAYRRGFASATRRCDHTYGDRCSLQSGGDGNDTLINRALRRLKKLGGRAG